MSFISAFILI